MPKGHPALSEVQKKEIVARVSENGERVPDLAREFNVHSKVKRENEALLTHS
jgi:transposase-like protein